MEPSFPILRASPRTQADALSTGPESGIGRCIGPKRLAPRPAIPPPYRSAAFSVAGPSIGLPRMREMKLQDLKAKTPAELVSFAEELEVENASTMRKQELMFAHPQAARDARDRHHRRRRGRGALRRLRLPALAGSELPARARRHLRLALADPPLRPAHRRHHRRPHPLARRKASAISRCSRSTPSISRTPRRRATRSTSTT